MLSYEAQSARAETKMILDGPASRFGDQALGLERIANTSTLQRRVAPPLVPSPRHNPTDSDADPPGAKCQRGEVPDKTEANIARIRRCLGEVVAALPAVLAAPHASGGGSSAAGDEQADAGLGS